MIQLNIKIHLNGQLNIKLMKSAIFLQYLIQNYQQIIHLCSMILSLIHFLKVNSYFI
jgi:hypothetical protein